MGEAGERCGGGLPHGPVVARRRAAVKRGTSDSVLEVEPGSLEPPGPPSRIGNDPSLRVRSRQ